jgi:16S rRNA (uracil1498-N3)-methyltransferase
MKLQRFLIENLEFSQEKIVLKDKNLLNQILNVFRFKKGAQFIVFDGTGIEFLVQLEEASKKEILCEVKEEKQGLKRKKKLTLVFSMIKKENMELVLQKCTELGVTNFVPVISERTVKTGWNFERNERIVKEAVEQSGFSDLPVVAAEAVKLEKILEKYKKEKENFDGLAVLDFDGVPLSSVKHLISVDTVFVGPEGGWSEKERNLFKKYNVKSISLGTNTLRAETACISIASIFLL